MFGLVPFTKNNLIKKDELGRILDVFNEPFFNTAIAPVQSAVSGFLAFKVDVKDLDTYYELKAELPGVEKEDIILSYDKGYLTIQATSKDEENEEDIKYLRHERRFGSVSRSFYIDNIDEKHTKAEFKNGILTVILPKINVEDTAKHIEIK